MMGERRRSCSAFGLFVRCLGSESRLEGDRTSERTGPHESHEHKSWNVLLFDPPVKGGHHEADHEYAEPQL